jgi:hypothetical protein
MTDTRYGCSCKSRRGVGGLDPSFREGWGAGMPSLVVHVLSRLKYFLWLSTCYSLLHTIYCKTKLDFMVSFSSLD